MFALTIWGTKVQTSDNVYVCRQTSDKWELLMYILSLACLLYGWIYVILLCCAFSSLPLIIIFWCCYRRHMGDAMGLNRRVEQSRRKAEVQKVVKSLKTQLFIESNRKADNCIICMEKFKQEDVI